MYITCNSSCFARVSLSAFITMGVGARACVHARACVYMAIGGGEGNKLLSRLYVLLHGTSLVSPSMLER